MNTAKEIALQLYPEDWLENSNIKGFKHDNNAPKRAVAEVVAQHFIDCLKREGCVHNHMLGLCEGCQNEVYETGIKR